MEFLRTRKLDRQVGRAAAQPGSGFSGHLLMI
jgi:hypothetical protein